MVALGTRRSLSHIQSGLCLLCFPFGRRKKRWGPLRGMGGSRKEMQHHNASRHPSLLFWLKAGFDTKGFLEERVFSPQLRCLWLDLPGSHGGGKGEHVTTPPPNASADKHHHITGRLWSEGMPCSPVREPLDTPASLVGGERKPKEVGCIKRSTSRVHLLLNCPSLSLLRSSPRSTNSHLYRERQCSTITKTCPAWSSIPPPPPTFSVSLHFLGRPLIVMDSPRFSCPQVSTLCGTFKITRFITAGAFATHCTRKGGFVEARAVINLLVLKAEVENKRQNFSHPRWKGVFQHIMTDHKK